MSLAVPLPSAPSERACTTCSCAAGLVALLRRSDSIRKTAAGPAVGPSSAVDVSLSVAKCQELTEGDLAMQGSSTPSTSSPTSAQAGPSDIEIALRLPDIELAAVAGFLSFQEVVRAVLAGHDTFDALTTSSSAMKHDSGFASEVPTTRRKLVVPIVEVKLDSADILKNVSTKHIQVLKVWSRLAFDEVKRILGEEGPAAFAALERVSFKGCRVFGADAAVLAPLFAHSARLSLANFEKNFMNDEVVFALARSRSLANGRFDTLNLRFNQLTDRGACTLAEVLAAPHPTIETLNLKANRIADAGAVRLAEALETNGVLRVINLRRQFPGLTDTTAKAMVSALDKNSALRKLRLRRNRITDVGCVALAQAVARRFERLQASESSFELDLEENRIGMEGALALLECLRQVGPFARLEILLYGNSAVQRDALRLALRDAGEDPSRADDLRFQVEFSKAESAL